MNISQREREKRQRLKIRNNPLVLDHGMLTSVKNKKKQSSRNKEWNDRTINTECIWE
jgi:hypothetical protein